MRKDSELILIKLYVTLFPSKTFNTQSCSFTLGPLTALTTAPLMVLPSSLIKTHHLLFDLIYFIYLQKIFQFRVSLH